ncbi:MAG: hypothetical protein JWR02_1952 [Mucilaginibacter sp.]|nr:hypothetical protein [Mucilaginibacter sp.]
MVVKVISGPETLFNLLLLTMAQKNGAVTPEHFILIFKYLTPITCLTL